MADSGLQSCPAWRQFQRGPLAADLLHIAGFNQLIDQRFNLYNFRAVNLP
jgi:hypothetical protein